MIRSEEGGAYLSNDTHRDDWDDSDSTDNADEAYDTSHFSRAQEAANYRKAARHLKSNLPINADDASVLPGKEAVLASKERRPVEFKQAMECADKTNNHFGRQSKKYKEFLNKLQKYQLESEPVQDVYVHVQKLFKAAPDLLEEFKQFLPHTADEQQHADLSRSATGSRKRAASRRKPAPSLRRSGHPKVHHTMSHTQDWLPETLLLQSRGATARLSKQ